MKQLRPRFLPRFAGIASENAAHRIAVEWDTSDGVRTGVYIPRRDTSLWLNVVAGGRIFPGVHHHARFDTRESDDHYVVEMNSLDRVAHVLVDGEPASTLPTDSVFDSIKAVSDFFESGSLGYSPASSDGQYDGLELRTRNWQVEALDVSVVQSSFFDDRNAFPEGSVTFDNALLMTGIEHEWHERETLCCA